MTNIQAVRALLELTGEDRDLDAVLIYAAIAVLDREEKQATPVKAPEPAPEKKKNQKPFDIGKAVACYKAGRTISWIADEMGVSAVTVSNHLKKAGVKK